MHGAAGRRLVRALAEEWLPDRLVPTLLERAGIEALCPSTSFRGRVASSLVEALKRWEMGRVRDGAARARGGHGWRRRARRSQSGHDGEPESRRPHPVRRDPRHRRPGRGLQPSGGILYGVCGGGGSRGGRRLIEDAGCWIQEETAVMSGWHRWSPDPLHHISRIQHPKSRIQYPVSSIQSPASHIPHCCGALCRAPDRLRYHSLRRDSRRLDFTAARGAPGRETYQCLPGEGLPDWQE